jgi:signal transduction histidine kinase
VSLRWIRPACIALLLASWAIDLLTPQLLIVAILLNAPIALSSLASDSRFTRWLVALAVAADVSGGYVNGLVEGHWDGIALANRGLAALSFLMVGGLSITAQSSARRAGELAARATRAAGERALRRAVETIRNSSNAELICRHAVGEARDALHVDRAILYRFQGSRYDVLTYEVVADDIAVSAARPAPAIASLIEGVAERRTASRVEATEPIGRMVLDELGVGHALAVPLAEAHEPFGLMLVGRRAEPFEEFFEEAMGYYAEQTTIALAQAALFEQLADRNAELAGANASLRERGDVINSLVYALSHDLRTPLAAAGLTLRQALDGKYGALPAAYRDILERTIRSNDELQRLSETLLLVSRYESGDVSARRDAVDLGALLRGVGDELAPLWQEKNIIVQFDAASGISALGDETELRRALVNLLANAVKFTLAGGHIDLRVVAGPKLKVIVEDNGFGVPEAERATLFERAAGSSRQGAGSGLGLYLVRRIVEAHGGAVRYAPRSGGGSVFTLELPAVPQRVPA